ncbi:MAG: glycosyltransferase family 4 protein [Verrucomicrobia bacterium]|nr:glycosyltransferase family 4 protein [Verrucomicrobiota bacterium]MBU1734815.1 glycosyltransferase family 4 protein [Verrucomicrobiota bacterium]MBU1858175.1 glycosyltransferase family 4 protein [Verrucomicrobiota bacterium]
MKILLLAPHPFFQERGTPIAVDLLLTVLSRRGDQVDVVTFHEGTERVYPGVTLHRIPRLPGMRDIRPGFSFKKLVCDVFVLAKALHLAAHGHYQVVHAVEESVFMAMLIRLCLRTPYVFDMDSSMPQQMTEKFRGLAVFAPILKWFEGRAIRHALAVVPVCDALAELARPYAPRKLCLLRDVSLLMPEFQTAGGELPSALSALPHPCFLYIGNLERYQGLDLLLDSFALLLKSGVQASLVIAGGKETDIRHYQEKAGIVGLGKNVRFLGPWPIGRMAELFTIADVLVSPRIQGNNTPMKIYSYLQSGKPILATDLPTHTQVLSSDVAVLASPTPAHFAAGMRRLIEHPAQGQELARQAKTLATEQYSWTVFERNVRELYAWIEHTTT